MVSGRCRRKFRQHGLMGNHLYPSWLLFSGLRAQPHNRPVSVQRYKALARHWSIVAVDNLGITDTFCWDETVNVNSWSFTGGKRGGVSQVTLSL